MAHVHTGMHLEFPDACSFVLPCSSFHIKKAKTKQERPTTPVTNNKFKRQICIHKLMDI